ncbi:phosphatase PAP2 family protein [Streptococcus sp. DD12]|uniref:phosphatase PAP2 family protein n=1 Tax=Streptococcus sp. DD12 TaxID=1777880 RepID=UPI00079C24F4|nr:phosphatase PAP2 family protein [Streptococcus sp. DD12]KXT75979.1 Membrane-associated phospholipid phosphatase [Streptococcus sp. DD12]
MKNKRFYHLQASFAALIFVILGYVVKFYPDALKPFDHMIQTAVRGQLPAMATAFFSHLTVLGNTSTQVVLIALIALLFASPWVKWYAESLYLLANGLVGGLLILTLKNIYQRPRPSISHLVEASGYSFPSGHSLGSMVIFGTLVIVFWQRFGKSIWGKCLVLLFASLIGLIGLSRIYVGVHYPSDVLAGFVLGYGLLCFGFPTYDSWRFKWRFQSKQN